eukprot:TRINITY_DN19572_c0_g4_i1.p1 TRINITY_DN19572_c0_g4~~TRINITY_DN19572_c0_g4_i1.p1  ORF type:complete len:425 (-),score=34.41 TRINITY_DN19572_c0_g4_i1:114-1367(-)
METESADEFVPGRRVRRRRLSAVQLCSLVLVGIGSLLLIFGGVGWAHHIFKGPKVLEHEVQHLGGPGGGRGVPYLELDLDNASCRMEGACGLRRVDAACQCDPACSGRRDCCADYGKMCTSYRPKDESLALPSSAPLLTFYVYRSQNAEDYPPLNANAASLAGVLWYLQNEVVNRCDSGRGAGEFGHRRFKITRILRYKITMRAPEPLYRAGMNFGVRVAFDAGKNTGAWYPNKDRAKAYDVFGYHVGCNSLGRGPYPMCPDYDGENYCPIKYKNAVWYSLPGSCPTRDIRRKTARCQAKEPGGFCMGVPTGQGNCTWTYEEAGEVDIDALVGITPKFKSHYDFCKQGCLEYVKYGWGRDKGKCVSWWDRRWDSARNAERVRLVDEAFKEKYPNMPSELDLPAPSCDFKLDPFYRKL